MPQATARGLPALLLAVLLLLGLSGPLAAAHVGLFIDGREVELAPQDEPPRIVNGRALAPARYLAEYFSARVSWDAADARVTIERPDDLLIQFWIGEAVIEENGQQTTLDVAPLIHNGRSLVPVRFLAQALGATVAWNPAARAIEITSPPWITGADLLMTGESPPALRLHATADRTPHAFTLTNPDRIVVDLADMGLTPELAREMSVGMRGIEAVRFGQPQPGQARVVIDLAQPQAYEVVGLPGTGLEVRFPQLEGEVLGPAPPGGGDLSGWCIFVDPGHGGSDTGAVGPTGLVEKDVNLAVALQLRQRLEAAGAAVQLSREDDIRLSEERSDDLRGRPDMANAWGADLFISIHFNGHSSAAAAGTETYYFGNHALSRLLTEAIHHRVTGSLQRPDRGVKRARFRVLRFAEMPAALLEGLFLTNPTEEQLAKDPAVQQAIAAAVRDGIIDFARRQEARPLGGC